MAERQKFGYEQTLLYGRYTRELGTFAKFTAKRLKKEAKLQREEEKPPSGIWLYLNDKLYTSNRIVRTRLNEVDRNSELLGDDDQHHSSEHILEVGKIGRRCSVVKDFIVKKIGEDWLFLALLGVLMAFLSFTMDYVIEKCQEAKFWLYKELEISVALQYFAWVSYSVLFILFATGFTHLVSPQAVGSGIPEMKTILRGVVLKEYLTFRTLVAKIIGLCSSLGSTLPLGKEGPFVHIASIVATLLSKMVLSFRGIFENESRRSEMLAAACAVGVAGTFAAPIGGVLFSIEVTATYFAVRNYWRGFFSAVCGALVFRLLALWFKDEETITAVFRTSLRTEFPFDALELIAFAAIGVASGFGGALFILMHRKIILLMRRHKRVSTFLQKNRFIYPGLVAFVISSLTFPPGLGQFFAGQLTNRQAINELFSNITWTTGQAEDLDDEAILQHWKHPDTNIYVTLVLFIIMTFQMGVFSNTLPIPAGIFVPVFTKLSACLELSKRFMTFMVVTGAAFGRLVGESMAAWFPGGIRSGNVLRKIVPGGYAVVGAASLSGSVTRTISTAVIVFELTGQISHVLPAVLSVLIANAVANLFQPSFYDSIIRLKRLPYLPDIVSSKSSTWNVFVEDFMIKDLHFIAFNSTYGDLHRLMSTTYFKSYPLVDSPDSMVLLGSMQRYELERILLLHLSYDREVPITDILDEIESGRSTPTMSYAMNNEVNMPPRPRFVVTKVDDPPPDPPANGNDIQLNMLKVPSTDSLEVQGSDNYNTYQGPLRSILKKSSSSHELPRRASTGDLQGDVNKFYRKLANQRKESIVEDRPFTIQKGSLHSLCKKVKLPPEPMKVKNLPAQEQEAWEQEQLLEGIQWEGVQIDPAPFQLVERTSLHKVHSLFSLLGLNHAYVTNTGKLVGVVGLKELRVAVQGHLDAQAENKNVEESEADELDDPAQLEVEHVAPEDPYTLVNADKESIEKTV